MSRSLTTGRVLNSNRAAVIQKQNLTANSTNFTVSGSSLVNLGQTTNSIANPYDGAITASAITEVADGLDYVAIAGAPTFGIRHSISFWAKAGALSWIAFYHSGAAGGSVSVNLSTGLLGLQASDVYSWTPVAYPNGWYLCRFSWIQVNSNSAPRIYGANADGGFSLTGTVAGTIAFYLFGAQVTRNAGGLPNYTATTGTAVNNTVGIRDYLLNSQNMIRNSNAFGSWNLTNATVTSNSTANPIDGLVNADTLVENTTSGAHAASGVSSASSIVGNTYTVSVYAKAGTRNWMHISMQGFADSAWFDLQNGVVGSNSSNGSATTISKKIQSLGNGWYRCAWTYKLISNAGSLMVVGAATGDLNLSYVGTNGNGALILYAAQVNSSYNLKPAILTGALETFGLSPRSFIA